jgi:hypothetical protein
MPKEFGPQSDFGESVVVVMRFFVIYSVYIADAKVYLYDKRVSLCNFNDVWQGTIHEEPF